MWPFKPKQRIIDRRNMNEDWRVGDLAVCVDDNWRTDYPTCSVEQAPKVGDVHRVERVTEGRTLSAIIIGLILAGKPDCYECTSFRKVRPDAEPAEEEFTALIRKMKPAPAPQKTPSRTASPGMRDADSVYPRPRAVGNHSNTRPPIPQADNDGCFEAGAASDVNAVAQAGHDVCREAPERRNYHNGEPGPC